MIVPWSWTHDAYTLCKSLPVVAMSVARMHTALFEPRSDRIVKYMSGAAGNHARACLRSAQDCEWDVELYGKLLSVGGGKERMTAHWNGKRSSR